MGANEEWLAYREAVKRCTLCGSDVSGRPVPAYFHPSKCEALLVGFEPEPCDHKTKQVVCYTGETGNVILDAALRAGLAKHEEVKVKGKKVMKLKLDMRVGFTTCIKCVTPGRARRKVAKQCMETFRARELAIRKPLLIGVLGIPTAKLLLPNLFSVRKKAGLSLSDYAMVNSFFNEDGVEYLILPNPSDLISRGKYDTASGAFKEFAYGMTLVAEYLEAAEEGTHHA